jgi:hypothetical protein
MARVGDKKARAIRKAAAAKKASVPFVTYAPDKHQTKAEAQRAATRAAARKVRSAARLKAKRAAFKKLELAGPLDYDGCAAQALAAHLQLTTGYAASYGEVRALFTASGGRESGGVTLGAVLDALAGGWPLGCRPLAGFHAVDLDDDAAMSEAGLILGVSLPGPHAVVADEDGDWLTWGMAVPAELFPEALITEAWSAEWGSAAGRDSNPQPLISGGYAPGPLRLPHSARSAELPAALVPSC